MLNKELAKSLLEIKAVALTDTKNLFTWASGIKSPIYCDNRLTISYPEVRAKIINGFVDLVNNKFPEAEVIAGTATAGIPHAAWVSDRLNLPMVYVRSSAKDHGKSKQIEGVLLKGQKVVLVEDLLSTGGSSLKAVQALRDAGAEVLGVIAIFTYGFNYVDENFAKEGLPYFALTDYTTLLPIAVEHKYIDEAELSLLNKWREDPKIFM